MANISKIKYLTDNLSTLTSQIKSHFDGLRHLRPAFDMIRSAEQFSAFEKLRTQSLMAEKAKALSNFSLVIQAKRIADELLSFNKLKELTLSTFVEEHVNTFKHVSSALDMLRATEQLSAFQKIKEQSLLSDSVKALSQLSSSIDIQKITEQFSTVNRLKEVFESSVFTQQYLESLKSISMHDHLANIFMRNDLDINPDGTVTVGDDVVSSHELNESIQDFFSHINDRNFINKFTEYLQKLRRPIQIIVLWIIDKIIITFIIGIVSSIYAPTVQEYLNQFSFNSKREVLQQVKKLPPEIDLSELSDYRVVTASRLRLRKKANINSTIIDELERGKLVRVLEKTRTWTLVEVIYDDSEDPIIGWVFTRYIAKLKR